MTDELSTLNHPARSVDHPAVRRSVETCEACPEQHEGQLDDGRFFYYRFRHGSASLALGESAEAVAGRMDYRHRVRSADDGDGGAFIDPAERARVFGELLTALDSGQVDV